MTLERRILGLVATLHVACAPLGDGAPHERVQSALSTPTRGASIPIGIENVNDSPMKNAGYRALLRFVPDATTTIDRFYFGFKLRGASCWDAGLAGYGSGDGGLLEASLVDIDGATGLPTTTRASETVNGCTRHGEAAAEVGGNDPVLVWVNTPTTLQAGVMYGLVVRNAHASPTTNFFSFNMPLADTTLAGPHARNELDPAAPGAILSLDPREHVAWSTDSGATWHYGSDNGQYRSYMNNDDHAHPATRMPQYGWRRTDGVTVGQQPYYAYNDDCGGCTVTYANARYARTFTEVGGFIASGTNVGTLTFTNTSKGTTSSCTPPLGYGFRTCTLPAPVSVAVGEDYTVGSTGSVEIMRMDNPQRVMFPRVGTRTGELRSYQAKPAPGTNAKDVPNLWAGPLSANFPAAGEVDGGVVRPNDDAGGDAAGSDSRDAPVALDSAGGETGGETEGAAGAGGVGGSSSSEGPGGSPATTRTDAAADTTTDTTADTTTAGCGCRSAGAQGASAAWWLVALAVAGLHVRRRGRSKTPRPKPKILVPAS